MLQETIPDSMLEEQRRHKAYATATFLGSLGVAATLAFLWPIAYELGRTPPARLSAEWLESVAGTLLTIVGNPMDLLAHGIKRGFTGIPGWVYGLITTTVFGTAMALGFLVRSPNPYRNIPMIHGDARFATPADIPLLSDPHQPQFGPTGPYLDLGNFNGEKIGLNEPLTVLGLAPPGTGKTAGLVVPSILRSDTACMVIHDPKPEIWQICSGYRGRLGPTYRVDWSKVDDPEAKIFHPRFNFLDPALVPKRNDPQRDVFVDALAQSLLPEKPSDGGNAKFFTDKGRAALTGMIHFLLCRVNDRLVEDPHDALAYEGIPAEWHGKWASLSMLVDWFTHQQMQASASGGGGFGAPDPMSEVFRNLVKEAVANNYAARAVRELQPLAEMARDERSGVLGNVDQALLPFKNAAVTERTSASDFLPCDLHGMLKPATLKRLGLEKYPRTAEEWDAIEGRITDDDWEPVTVMCCIDQAVAQAFANITGLFFEICSRELLSYGPGEKTRLGAKMGPFATCMMMDEFPKMAKCNSVVSGPDLGRSKKVMYVLIGQAISQIEEVYSANQRKTLMSTSAIKYILPQNDPDTIAEIAKLVGPTTVVRKTFSRTSGFTSPVEMMKGNLGADLQKAELLNQGNVGHMAKGTHMLIMQNWAKLPMICETSRFFTDPEYIAKAFNPRTNTGIPPCRELPGQQLDARIAEQEQIERTRDHLASEYVQKHTLDPAILSQTPTLSP